MDTAKSWSDLRSSAGYTTLKQLSASRMSDSLCTPWTNRPKIGVMLGHDFHLGKVHLRGHLYGVPMSGGVRTCSGRHSYRFQPLGDKRPASILRFFSRCLGLSEKRPQTCSSLWFLPIKVIWMVILWAARGRI